MDYNSSACLKLVQTAVSQCFSDIDRELDRTWGYKKFNTYQRNKLRHQIIERRKEFLDGKLVDIASGCCDAIAIAKNNKNLI